MGRPGRIKAVQRAALPMMTARMTFVVCCSLFTVCVTRAALTAAQNASTIAFLRSFTVSMPGLANLWTGDDWCTWPYVRCNSDTSIALVIDSAGLTGSLPELNVSGNGATVALTEIAVANMNITGGFKSTWGSLRALQALNFTNTNLFGTIPESWNAMRSLQRVIVKNASACGSLPSWTLRSLKSIDVSNNMLRGPLPETWGSIAGMQSVDLTGNSFCGCKPPSWVSRVLTDALFRAMGSAPFDLNCKAPINCASEGAKCSRDAPQYRDTAAFPSCVVVAALSLVVVLISSISM
ncbi:hypothetical protein LSCM1_07579 [Leishmania martiniquensis]|uniref:Surface antigen-like protein n=1 Tax=Leishmania martiniquensis TaxID=1580590 RepID=A0A836KSA2_9TRYP|nr:hypothetical protein LSCM1_07579 [Leishmania martiniquensis]